MEQQRAHKRCSDCGKGRQRCKLRDHYSLRGHYPGEGRCPYHWTVLAYGKVWADRCKAIAKAEERKG